MPYSFTEDEFNEVVGEIYRRLVYKKKRVEEPLAVILGGQPGAGKTTLQKIVLENDENTIIINGDSYRSFHPKFFEILKKEPDYVSFTQPFSNRMVETLIDMLSENHYNLVIEGTLRTIDVPLKRKTAKENHDKVIDSISINLDKIYQKNAFDNIKLFNREKNCLYNYKKDKYNRCQLLYDILYNKENTK